MRARHLVPVVLLALAGCAPGNPGLVIANVIAPDDQCIYSAMNAYIAVGKLDVSAPSEFTTPGAYEGYFVSLALSNQMISLANTGAAGFPIQAEPNQVTVDSVEVELRDIGGNPLALGDLPNPYLLPAGSSLVPPGDGMSPGIGQVGFFAIPPAYVGVLGESGTIIVSMRAIGASAGGAELVTAEYNFPLDLCNGCLILGCLRDSEGEPVCRPACFPGQDRAHISCDAACGGPSG